MSTYFLKICCALLLLLLYTTAGSIHGYNMTTVSEDVKCIEKERQALLNFKQSLFDDYGMLSTWRDDHDSRDCCKWRGVVCGNETGHVLKLRLRGSRSYQSIQYLSGEINSTASLLELQNLQYLDISFNDFSGSEIPKHMGSFHNLRYLNMSNSKCYGRIPYQLGNLSQLEYLDLKQIDLVGAIPSQLGKLTHLRYLDLSVNYGIDGEIPHQLGNLSQLRYLDLGGNSLSGSIPFHIGNLPLLETLRLNGNSDLRINDGEWLSTLPSLKNLHLSSITGFSHRCLQIVSKLLPKLKELGLAESRLSDNDIRSLFESHSNFSTSLTILDLSSNMLTSSTFRLLSNFSFNLQELYLSDNNIVMSFPPYLNCPSLVVLDLSGNNLSSTIFQGNSNFGSKLEELHLEGCSLSDSSFRAPSPTIMNFSSSLVILGLSSNMLTSAIFPWLFNFTSNLHTLGLHENLLEGPIPNGFGKEMNSLEVLSLSNNKLRGELPSSLGNICTLQELYLSGNNLSGEMSRFIQDSSMCIRQKLQILDLSNNRITGLLPDLSFFSFLRQLDISGNQLIGEIPKSFGLLYKFEALFLEGNSLEGDITELHVNNLSNLKVLDLSDNSLSLKFGTKWIPPFQLVVLGLASCKLGPSFPSWLQTQKYLNFIDISDAGINDSVPVWFWNKLQSISEMNMSYNNLIGTIPNIPFKLDDTYVVLNSNQFEGSLPAFLLQASTLDLSNNKISDLNTFLCGKSTTTNLHTLDLSDNQIKGQLPDCWGHLNSLKFLDLSNNRLSGKIPPSMTTLVNMEDLVLRNNSLIGELPITLKNCTNLAILDVSENFLSGPIPSWIGESLPQLEILSLRVNHFFGTLPSHLCYLSNIRVLDFSGNNLLGSIPVCLKNFTAMVDKSIDLSGIVRTRLLSTKDRYEDMYESNVLLTWKGQDYLIKNPELLLKSIDLSSNHISGAIPTELAQLLGLVSLNLSRNNLSGEIPSDIGNLNLLEFLDLSNNRLSGKIPSTLSLIDRLGVLDLSNNSLYGKIPSGAQLQTFEPSSFEGNLGLCGKPLERSCPEDEIPIKPQGPAADDKDDNSVFYEALYMSLGIGFFTGFWGLIGSILLWKPWRNAYLKFLNKLSVNLAKWCR